MTRYRRNLGQSGEQLAVQYLTDDGYTIVATNYTTRFAEIDIIAAKDNCLVFVEVKARAGLTKGLPREAVNPAKQHKILLAAQQFIKTGPVTHGFRIRFDVMEIFFDTDPPRINHIPHAFQAG
jgi:putative endonuclease